MGGHGIGRVQQLHLRTQPGGDALGHEGVVVQPSTTVSAPAWITGAQ
jgi:hypothetical protein